MLCHPLPGCAVACTERPREHCSARRDLLRTLGDTRDRPIAKDWVSDMSRTHAFATAHARPSLAPRPSAVVLWAFVLAYGGTSWLQVVARAEGTPEPGETVLIPWLRDATLALPLVFVGTWL